MSDTQPGGAMGRPLTARDHAAQEAVFGSDRPGAADQIALRDARGVRFQRLEFLGDSVLDLLALRHLVAWTVAGARPPCCARQWFDPTDHELGIVARAHGLTALADWPLVDQRAADLVEASVAAGFLALDWAGALSFAALRIHPVDAMPTGGRGDPAAHRRVVCELGSQVFDTYSTQQVFSLQSDADEGILSQARAALITNQRRAGLARSAGLTAPEHADDQAWADRLDFDLGTRCLGDGIPAALAHVGEVTRR